ncbi:MAG: hypothetical protein M1825_000973 [Sarcosagium campestre]|nr:MAG: hypothetical protein M1825_000973 [Sarcosagium campestre]
MASAHSPPERHPDFDEQSPLLVKASSEDGNAKRSPAAPHGASSYDPGAETKSSLYLVLLTISIAGLQIFWAVELSSGTPFLLSLGLSKAMMSLVWVAGPLTGILVQPYVGIQSDNCRISWGRRKPFLIGGCIVSIFSLLALSWSREIVRGVMGAFGARPDASAVITSIQVFAVILVFVLDCGINTVQAAIRAFVVDNAPTHQQETANAWAGRMTGIGNIFGYLAGYADLPSVFPFLGNTQFKVFCAIACIALVATTASSCSYIRERDPRLNPPSRKSKAGLTGFAKQIYTSIVRLPPQVRKVCEVQFFAWMGWFPFMYYITTYIGQLYVDPFLKANPSLDDAELDTLWEEATRIGTFALLIFAFTSFSANILLPFIVAPSYAPASQGPRLAIRALTLRRAWLLSHLLLAVCLFTTLFISTPQAATALVGVVGIAWALTLWAPFALISAEISKRDLIRRLRHPAPARSTSSSSSSPPSALRATTDDRDPDHDPEQNPDHHNDDNDDDEPEDQAGVVLGLHNVAISAPQVISSLISSAIFKALQKPRGVPGDESVGWAIRAGAFATIAAAAMTMRVREGWQDDEDMIARGELDPALAPLLSCDSVI